MTEVSRHALVPIGDVFAALTDPHTYPQWLVGCREIRGVDDGWPEVGTSFHHRVGLFGPITLADHTKVIDVEPCRHLALEVMARPFIRARVDFVLSARRTAASHDTRISLSEVPIGIYAPLGGVLAAPTAARNRVSLNALVAFLNDPGNSND
jgi:uncharacterized protein YndB with AHSA1/START domain